MSFSASKRWLPRTLVLLVASVVAPGPFAGFAWATPWGPEYFPNVPLVTQDGKTVHFYDDLLKGKVVAVDLIYTSCGYACPLETARLAKVQKLLGGRVGKDIFFYSISIDPTHDTPQALKAYAEKYGAGPGWTFLTGKPADIQLVAKKLGLQADPTVNADGHVPDLMIGNVPTGQWMRNSAVDNPKLLAMTMTRLLDGWSHHEVASRSYAEAKPIALASKGQYIFATRCIACHTIGEGDRIGPDLKNVTHRQDRAWLERYIAAPDRMLAEGDPIARALDAKYRQAIMPNFGLAPADVASILDYVEARSGSTTPAAGSAVATAPPGN